MWSKEAAMHTCVLAAVLTLSAVPVISFQAPYSACKPGLLAPFASSRVITSREANSKKLCLCSMSAGSQDIVIVGAGYLGKMLIHEYKTKFPTAKIIAETRTETKHDQLRQAGAEPRTRQQREDSKAPPADNVVFCAPPGGIADYPAEVSQAVSLWSGNGRFVFTSSTGVYAEEAGGVVNEESPVSDSARAAKLLAAETAVLDAGGTVLRLAGLYSAERGPHGVWLRNDRVDSRGDGLIGMVAYEDAARAVLAAVTAPGDLKSKVFLIADNEGSTRERICESARRLPAFRGAAMPAFAAGVGPLGKRFDSRRSRAVLGWEPVFPSFDDYCSRHAA